MGTRADFYIGRGVDALWVGSIALDGYPDGITPKDKKMEQAFQHGPMRHIDSNWPYGCHLFESTTETEFIERLERYFQYRDDVSRPDQGWPWPWETSNITDYAYAFDSGKVWCSRFGSAWFNPMEEPEEIWGMGAVFPNMKDQQKVDWSGRKSDGNKE